MKQVRHRSADQQRPATIEPNARFLNVAEVAGVVKVL
jgi:hypothetical protein